MNLITNFLPIRYSLNVSEIVFCIRCKSKTETENPTNVVSPKGVEMLQGICAVCKCKKSKLIKKLKKLDVVKEEPEEEAVESEPKRRKSGKRRNRTAIRSPIS